jgi:hypothetical protein
MSELTSESNEEMRDKPVVNPELEAIMAKIKKMEDSNARLLEESRGYKARYQSLKENVENSEKAKLTENEQWKELLEIERNKSSEFQNKLKETNRMVLQKELALKVSTLCNDAYNVQDIINNLPKDLINIDEENLSISGLEEAVNVVRQSRQYLFNTEKKSGMTSQRPVLDTSPEKDLRSTNAKLADTLSEYFRQNG